MNAEHAALAILLGVFICLFMNLLAYTVHRLKRQLEPQRLCGYHYGSFGRKGTKIDGTRCGLCRDENANVVSLRRRR